jgi:ABC-type lipoprotein export system ATPase subunit
MTIQTPDGSPSAKRQAQSERVLVVEGLCKYFTTGTEKIKAVDGVSFTCERRQFVTITGPSGCGKSTLLYLLGGLEKPTSGLILLDGVNVTALEGAVANDFRRRKIGFIFQAFHLIPNLSALENVMLPLQLAGVARSEQRERARNLLVQVGIDEQHQTHRPGKLSGGQQQRVAIARALANDPAVILADEPTGNLDAKNSKRIVDLLRKVAQQGQTVVMVTHERAIARQADMRIELLDGRIVALKRAAAERSGPVKRGD